MRRVSWNAVYEKKRSTLQITEPAVFKLRTPCELCKDVEAYALFIQIIIIIIIIINNLLVVDVLRSISELLLIPVVARSKAWVGGLSLAGIAGSNPAGGMDVCLLWMLWVVKIMVSASGWSLVQRSPTECRVSKKCVIVKPP